METESCNILIEMDPSLTYDLFTEFSPGFVVTLTGVTVYPIYTRGSSHTVVTIAIVNVITTGVASKANRASTGEVVLEIFTMATVQTRKTGTLVYDYRK